MKKNCQRIRGGMSNGIQICIEKVNATEFLTEHSLNVNAAKCVFGEQNVIVFPFNWIVMNKGNKCSDDFDGTSSSSNSSEKGIMSDRGMDASNEG